MCLRPDISYVVSEIVWMEYCRLENDGIHGMTAAFYHLCNDRITAADAAGNTELTDHWTQVLDIGARHCCSPLSPVEVNGKRVHELDFPIPDKDRVRVYIANPNNPAHQHGQGNITQTSMRELNRAWLQEQNGE